MRIFDCFPFNNELEIVELRFMELGNKVDKFVVVEANRTHTGKPKPFNFEDNQERFKPWLDKIIYVKVEDLPIATPDDAWVAEKFQRDCISRGLVDARSGDVIVVSDADEIPHPEGLYKAVHAAERVIFYPALYYYYVNCLANKRFWGSVVAEHGTFNTPQQLRQWAWKRRPSIIPPDQQGWHYSYMGGGDPKKVLAKIDCIVEGGFNNGDVRVNSIDKVDYRMTNLLDPWYGERKSGRNQTITVIDQTQEPTPRSMAAWLLKYPQFLYKEGQIDRPIHTYPSA